MSYFDIIPILIILLFALLCYRKGLLKASLGLVAVAGAFLFAAGSYPIVAQWLGLNFSIEPLWLNPLAFTLLFIGALFTFYIVAIFINKWVPQRIHAARANKLLGLIPGLAAGWFMALLIARISTASTSPVFLKQVEKSFFAASANRTSILMEDKLAAIFTPPVQKPPHININEGHVAIAGSQQFKTSQYVPRPDLEDAMLQLINTERAQNKLKPLRADNQMREAAAIHAADMFERGYFAHNSPEGTDPFARMQKLGIKYKSAGENLAYAATLGLAHDGLMESPGHRANILSPSYGRVGIAILDGGTKGLMFAQEFRD